MRKNKKFEKLLIESDSELLTLSVTHGEVECPIYLNIAGAPMCLSMDDGVDIANFLIRFLQSTPPKADDRTDISDEVGYGE